MLSEVTCIVQGCEADEIQLEMLKALDKDGVVWLTHLFNVAWRSVAVVSWTRKISWWSLVLKMRSKGFPQSLGNHTFRAELHSFGRS